MIFAFLKKKMAKGTGTLDGSVKISELQLAILGTDFKWKGKSPSFPTYNYPRKGLESSPSPFKLKISLKNQVVGSLYPGS